MRQFRTFVSTLCFVALVGCSIDGTNDQMNLVLACVEGDEKKVEKWLKQVEDPNFLSMKGDSPLTAAASNGHLDIVQILVNHGADINFKDVSGLTAYDIARKNGHKAVYEYLQNVGR